MHFHRAVIHIQVLEIKIDNLMFLSFKAQSLCEYQDHFKMVSVYPHHRHNDITLNQHL